MRRRITLSLLGAFTALIFSVSVAAIDTTSPLPEFENAEQEALYQGLVRELRCTVCQNQTLLDSNSGLAQDLRQNVYQQVRAGATRETVVDFMVNRYGEFVLYRPPLKSETALLWFGPLLFLIVGSLILAIVLRQQRNRPEEPFPVSEPAPTASTPTNKKRRRGK